MTMSLSNSSVKRAPDQTGDAIKVFDDGAGNLIQAAAIVDEDANQVGTASNPMPVDGSGVTQPVSAASLPLPTGAATESSLSNVSAGTQLARFGTCDVEVASATVTYVGKEDKDGSWLVQKIDTTSGTSIRYATVTNNPGYLNYSAAWAARASLTYQTYGSAF